MCADECHQTFLPAGTGSERQRLVGRRGADKNEGKGRTLGVLKVEKLERRRLLERTVEVPQLAVDLEVRRRRNRESARRLSRRNQRERLCAPWR